MADPEKMMQNCVINVCQPGSGLLAAGYCLYSSSVIFMLSIGNGCWGFTYDSLVGEFILTHPDLKARLSPRLLHYLCPSSPRHTSCHFLVLGGNAIPDFISLRSRLAGDIEEAVGHCELIHSMHAGP